MRKRKHRLSEGKPTGGLVSRLSALSAPLSKLFFFLLNKQNDAQTHPLLQPIWEHIWKQLEWFWRKEQWRKANCHVGGKCTSITTNFVSSPNNDRPIKDSPGTTIKTHGCTYCTYCPTTEDNINSSNPTPNFKATLETGTSAEVGMYQQVAWIELSCMSCVLCFQLHGCKSRDTAWFVLTYFQLYIPPSEWSSISFYNERRFHIVVGGGVF